MIKLAGILLLVLAEVLVLSHLIAGTCLASANISGNKITVKVTPAAAGRQLVRMSLPFSKGVVLEGETLRVSHGEMDELVALRPLTWHPVTSGESRSVRRGMVTFPYTFPDNTPVQFILQPEQRSSEAVPSLPMDIKIDGEMVTIEYHDGTDFRMRMLAPPRSSSEAPRTEVVESNINFLWQRIHLPDPEWPRIVEIRADILGGVTIIAHLQRNQPDNGRAPDFGWEVSTDLSSGFLRRSDGDISVSQEAQSHSFVDGDTCALFLKDSLYRIYHPTAPFKRRGKAEVRSEDGKGLTYRYWRCKADEKVPMQQAAWRRAEVVITPANMANLTPSLEYSHTAQVDAELWDELYDIGLPMDLKESRELDRLLRYHREAIVRAMSHGDDWGNVTSYSDTRTSGSVHGMNRLNHCPPIFEEGYRSGDRRLIEVAVLWCDNFYDLSIWWGPGATGGTRYNNVSGPDKLYMWRSNNSVHFCTKGYDNFLVAYEQTGDPRMMEALEAQVSYAVEHIHSDRGEARNIGDVADFVRLYRYTGEQRYLDEALRLFRELRTKLSEGDLFSQSGRPIVPNPPFIDDDQTGYKYPFAKPYIIGYALAGLPELLEYAPQEPKLRDVVQAVADFMADSQDPVGGWRYPHPRSTHVSMSQAIEHAWQLVQADKALGAQEKHLDAIERVLRQRVQGWLKTGRIFSGLAGWERTTGKIKNREEIYEIYQTPEDRDYTRDYTEGRPSFGGSSPEGLVYFPEVLAFYLKHRPASGLLARAGKDEPLGKVLAQAAD